ncbi:MAG: glycosyltransferase [Patescibacteria group bacterium]
MRILVDARHLTNPHPSGVGHYTLQLMQALFELDKENEYVLLTTGQSVPPLFPPKADHSVALAKGGKRGLGGVTGNHIDHAHNRTPNKLLSIGSILTNNPTLDRVAASASLSFPPLTKGGLGGVSQKFDLLFMPNLNITSIPNDLPYILTVHDLSWKIFPHFYSHKMRLWHKLVRPDELIAKASAIITPSESTKHDVVRMFKKNPNSIRVIPHGVSESFKHKMQPEDHGVRSKYKLPQNYALFIGTLEPRKNIQTILIAMEEYRKISENNIQLVIAGAVGWKSTKLYKKLREKNWVHLLNYVNDKDRPAIYRSAQLLIWPSFYEGFGLPVLEAMACGTPVITSHTSSMPEITDSAAIHVDPYNHHDVVMALEQLINSPSLADKLCSEGIERAAQFTWQKAAQDTLDIFNSINPCHPEPSLSEQSESKGRRRTTLKLPLKRWDSLALPQNDNIEERIDIINKHDEVIGSATKSEIYKNKHLHRIVHVLVFNKKGEMALQLQAKEKSFCPLHWSTAVGGHVQSGERPKIAATREMKEEIGINCAMKFFTKNFFTYKDSDPNNDLTKLLFFFKTQHEGPFLPRPGEVDSVEFFSFDQIQSMISKGEKFHPELLFFLEKYYKIYT